MPLKTGVGLKKIWIPRMTIAVGLSGMRDIKIIFVARACPQAIIAHQTGTLMLHHQLLHIALFRPASHPLPLIQQFVLSFTDCGGSQIIGRASRSNKFLLPVPANILPYRRPVTRETKVQEPQNSRTYSIYFLQSYALTLHHKPKVTISEVWKHSAAAFDS